MSCIKRLEGCSFPQGVVMTPGLGAFKRELNRFLEGKSISYDGYVQALDFKNRLSQIEKFKGRSKMQILV